MVEGHIHEIAYLYVEQGTGLFCISITGANNRYQASLETLLNIPTLHIVIKNIAAKSALRLKVESWSN